METIKNLIRLTIFSIVGLAAILVSVHFASMNDDSVTLHWEMPEAESMMAAVILIVGLFALVLLIKLACCVGPIVVGIFKVILFPITLPFKVLGMFSGGGGGSYSAPSYSAPSMPSAAPKAAKEKKTTWYYNLALADPSRDRAAGRICPKGSVKASNYSEAMSLVHAKEKNKLNVPSSMNHKMVINEVSERNLPAISYSSNR